MLANYGPMQMCNDVYRYESGDRLSPEHEKIILEKLLPFHPECEKKIGCGIDYITVTLCAPCFSAYDMPR